VVPELEAKDLWNRIREPECLLGRKTLELKILKDAVRLGREKKLISRVPLWKKDDIG